MTDDNFYRRPEGSKRERAAAHLERLHQVVDPVHGPVDWRAAAAKHDAFWGIKAGDLLPDVYRVQRPAFEAGDNEGRDD